MADKLTTALPKIAKLLRMVLSADATDGEWQNAFTLLMTTLKEADPGGHEITRRIETPSISDEDMQKILETGRELGRAEGIEVARRDLVPAAAPVSSIPGVSNGVGGYSWLEIAQHCARNEYCLNDWERGFIANVVRRLRYKPPSPNEASKLHQIFHERFGELI